MNKIAYKGGYKYQIVEGYEVDIPVKPEKDIDIDYVKLSPEGHLAIKKGYAWDGPSGPTIDTRDFMRGSLVHDALYQLIREGHLEESEYRDPADRLIRQMCLEDGMNPVRATWVYYALRWFGKPAADPAAKRPVIHAP